MNGKAPLDAASGGDAMASGGSGGSGGMGPDGCLFATVSRAAGDTQQPWVKAPLWADGVGSLVVSAVLNGNVSVRKMLANIDLKDASARHTVDLGCPGPNSYVVRAFLDDNVNAGPNDMTSTDHLDSCMGGAVPEKIEVVVRPGQTANVELVLYQSCDPSMD
ncbi:MAG: hypothetical protein H7X95_07485 [Deltaproteobacteria bacterium]|nr:hypothetical protein [Deltaproteobacteria bacterium]